MTIKDIQTRLDAWKAERRLTVEMQRAGFVSNAFEEVTEYLRAKDDFEKIDALCDIVVFSLNNFTADTKFSVDGYEIPVQEATLFETKKMIEIEKRDVVMGGLKSIMDKLAEIYDDTHYFSENDFKYRIGVIVHKCFTMMDLLGFNPFICMDETIKEISSRTGSYDESIGKFVKDKSPEAQAKWYKADYTKAKKGQKMSILLFSLLVFFLLADIIALVVIIVFLKELLAGLKGIMLCNADDTEKGSRKS